MNITNRSGTNVVVSGLYVAGTELSEADDNAEQTGQFAKSSLQSPEACSKICPTAINAARNRIATANFFMNFIFFICASSQA